MENSFNIGEREFKLRKISPFIQFHMVRRLGPVLSDLAPALGEIRKKCASIESMTEDQKLDAFAQVFAPLMMGMSKLNDKDADYVLHNLLNSAEI